MISQQDVDNATPRSPTPRRRCTRPRRRSPRRSSTSATRRSARRSTASPGSRSCASATSSARTVRRCSRPCRQLDPIRVELPAQRGRLREVPRAVRAPRWPRPRVGERQQFARQRRQPEASGVELVLADGSAYPHHARDRRDQPPDRRDDRHRAARRRSCRTPTASLRPGEYARVRIRRENEGKDVVVVPEKALLSVQGTYSAAVVGADNKVQLQEARARPERARRTRRAVGPRRRRDDRRRRPAARDRRRDRASDACRRPLGSGCGRQERSACRSSSSAGRSSRW